MEYSSTCYGLGSGTIVHHTLNKAYVLTAAHNIVSVDKHNIKQLEYPQYIWIEINKNTLNGCKTLKRYNCSDYHIHLSYIKYLQNGNINESATGYDIAIIEVSDMKNELRKIDPVKLRLFKSQIKDSMNVKVIGYPGQENKLRGQLYGMKGVCNFKYINDKIKYNKLLIYDNIDTSGGQSGSPIFECLDEKKNGNDMDDEKYDNNIYKSFGRIVGVHVVGIKKKKLNYGTFLNDHMLQCNKYEQYDVGVLLITSTKNKYESMLNKIYTKCIKTEIMSTIRLYYNYTDKETFHKKDVLCYFKTLFKQKRRTYLIFYCGESDENGNWIINKNKMDNMTLNDINVIANTKQKGSDVLIVNDCNYSGNWVQIYQQKNENEFKNIYDIQASSKPNEICNAGTFASKYAQCCFQYIYDFEQGSKAQLAGALITSVLGLLTVGTLYDGVIKQPYHKATKQSQPTTTGEHEHHIGYSRDEKYSVHLYCYKSWYAMDAIMTANGRFTVGTGGSAGFY